MEKLQCLCYIALLLSEYEGKHLLFSPLSTDLLQTQCCIALQCKTSTTLIILGLIDIISRCYSKPKLPNTTAAFFFYYSMPGINKTKGEFLSAFCIAIHNSASHANPFYFSEVKSYWQVPGRQGTTHQNFFPP